MNINLEHNIIKIAANRGWHFVQDKKQGLYVTRCEGKNGVYKVYLNTMNLAKSLLVVYSYIPLKVPIDKNHKMALLLNKINRDLHYGNFEIDYSNGDIAFRNGFHFLGQAFTEYMALNTMSPCAFTVDKYFPAIQILVETDSSPEDALRCVEK